MFVRLKTHEEDRDVLTSMATAVEVLPKDVSTAVKAKDNGHILEHLKRVKRMGNKILMLKHQGVREIPNGVVVAIPEFKPVTLAQFEIARQIWPCHFYNQFEEVIDQSESWKRMTETLIFYKSIFGKGDRSEGSKISGAMDVPDHFCSGVCTIFDGSSMLHKAFDHEYVLGHSVSDCVSMVSRNGNGYLCTGYSAFLYQEPCISCAMALVHGRIKRVFCHKRGLWSQPFSKMKFNYNKNLNHRFNVYFYES